MPYFRQTRLCSWRVSPACPQSMPVKHIWLKRNGRYDAIVRIFDRRNIKTPMMEHDVGGGVWRLRWNPEEPSMLLAACMHDGFKVLDVDLNASSITTELRFDAHGKDALAYGADWCRVSNMRKSIVCSCSFYDHQLRTWPTPCPSQLTT